MVLCAQPASDAETAALIDAARIKRLDKHPALRRLIKGLVVQRFGTDKKLVQTIGFGASRLIASTCPATAVVNL